MMNADMQQRIRRMFGMMLFAFLVLIGWQSYWHLYASDWLLMQPGNRRMSRAERNIARGTVYDRHGRRLAWTEHGVRRYADPVATAAVLGYLDPRFGRTGVEGAWDLELSGLSTHFTGTELRRILIGEKPHGKDLVLTLDLRLQRAALDALDGRRGAVVVLDPGTGAILALSSSPTFNPLTIGTEFERLSSDGTGALRNRAVQDFYPPGSTMKLVTAAAALMGDHGPSTRFVCPGTSRIYRVNVTDYHGAKHGELAMDQAMTVSCNNYFARLAVATRYGQFSETAEAFGFGATWWHKLQDRRMLPIPVSRSSLMPRGGDGVPDGELAHMGFGQSTVVATPLQMAMVAAGIANGVELRAPYLVAEVRKGGTEQVLQRFTSYQIGFPLNLEASETLARMMRLVVTRGTARGASVAGATVYGKTGTAEQHGGRDHAWFVGFAEKEEGVEKVAFAVLIERGGTGGRVAVPVARQVLSVWARGSGR